MLHKVRIKGYRALHDLELSLPVGRPLVLIGGNATGKSTILDALSLIQAVADGRAGRGILNRGGWNAVTWAGGGGELELGVQFAAGTPIFAGEVVEYRVRLGGTRSGPTVLAEELEVYKEGLDRAPTVVLKGGSAGWATNAQTGVQERITPGSADGMVMNSVLSAIADEARYPTPMRVKAALQAIACYPSFALGATSDGGEGHDPIGARPAEMTRRIKSSGRDLLNALHTLSSEHPRVWDSLLTDLRAVFPWCGSLRFPPGPGRGLITLTWVDARSGATLYLDDMSEGMRVFLALLAALHAPDDPAVIAIDEPERSLHPHALRRIVKVMESRAERTSIIIATHSDRLLDHLEAPSEALRITRFSSAGGVTAEKLDPELLQAWLAEYTLSELRARDILERSSDEGAE